MTEYTVVFGQTKKAEQSIMLSVKTKVNVPLSSRTPMIYLQACGLNGQLLVFLEKWGLGFVLCAAVSRIVCGHLKIKTKIKQ